MSKRGFSLALASLVVLAASVSLASQDRKEKKKKESPQPAIVTLTTAIPSVAALEESQQSQSKGGVRITVETETYKALDSMTSMQRDVPPPTFLGLVVIPSPDARYVETTFVPALNVSPSRLSFHVRISNGLPRVFRGSGIAVQFNVAGKISTVDPSGYGDLVNVIVPPRGEQDLMVVGPDVSSIPPQCTVGLFLYDVVTNTDKAGNVTEKQNFEWYFSFKTQSVEKAFSVPPPTRQWIIPRH
jgi:hypothetical protein